MCAEELTDGWTNGRKDASISCFVLFYFFETGIKEGVESWMMIDVRETRLVSAILFQTYAFETVAVLHQGDGLSFSYIGSDY